MVPPDLLIPAIIAFALMLTGLGLTVFEFRRTKRTPVERRD